eukprot:7881551-Alexandrium_andersonii.AAC.1
MVQWDGESFAPGVRPRGWQPFPPHRGCRQNGRRDGGSVACAQANVAVVADVAVVAGVVAVVAVAIVAVVVVAAVVVVVESPAKHCVGTA